MDRDAVEVLIRRICEGATLTRLAEGPPDLQRSWYERTRGGEEWVLSLSDDSMEDLITLMRTLRTDDRIAANVPFERLEQSTIEGLFDGAEALRDGTLDERLITDQLIHSLLADVHDWYVVARVHGLDMAPGYSVSLAGLHLGRLPNSEVEDIMGVARQVGSTKRLTHEGEPGSGLEYVLARTAELLEDDNGEQCWAWGAVPATDSSVDRVFYERLQIIALNILRCFAPYAQQNPESLSLGEPPDADVNKRLHYDVSNPGQTFTIRYSRFSLRHPLALSKDSVAYLATVPAWARAREISETAATDRTDLEDTLLRAMLQFGVTTSFDVPEARLAGYLTTLEAMLLGEDDYSCHDTKIGRRVSELLNFDARDLIADMYRARQGPVHRAERSLGGRMTVLLEELDRLRYHTFSAIMVALERSGRLSTRQALLSELDQPAKGREDAAASMIHYPFTVRRVPATGHFEASCPDFPGRGGSGLSRSEAQERARIAVDTEVRRLVQDGIPPPPPGAVDVNMLPVWAPSEPDEIASYLARADELEERQHQRLRNMRGARSLHAKQLCHSVSRGKSLRNEGDVGWS